MFKKQMGFVTLITIAIAIVITLIYEFDWLHISPDVMLVVRWV